MARSLPRIVCERRNFGSVDADAEAPEWRSCSVFELGDVITGAPPKQPTQLRVAWDHDDLRVLLRVEDTHIAATLIERDAPLYTEEVVEVFLDPVGDLECYFEIEVNPLNTVLDLVLRRIRSGYRKDFAWRCDGLRTHVRPDARGWTAELAIPFRSLAADVPKSGAEWRVNFTRIDRPPGIERELSAWAPTGLANFHVPERFGVLTFAD